MLFALDAMGGRLGDFVRSEHLRQADTDGWATPRHFPSRAA